jgi:translation initiation factor IF-2
MAIKKALLAENLILEDFGGEIPAVEVSGLTGQGLNALIETISVVAELADIRAEHTGDIFGYVLESNVHKGLGLVCFLLSCRVS